MLFVVTMSQEFADDPSEEAFHGLTKDQLLEVADIFKIEVSATEKRLKHTIKSVLLPFLIEKGVLPRVDMREAVRLKELSVREKELDNEREVIRLKVAENQLQLRELEIKARTDNLDLATTGSFDASRHIRLVPPFVEKDVERYFPHFEKVALSLKWPKDVWPLLVQSVLVGRAQEMYASLSVEQSADYDFVKASILRGYELVPEAYRQRFRRFRKGDRQTYLEFAREKETLFDRWCSARVVDSQAKLRELILLEEFKNCLPSPVATYLNERQTNTVREAAVLADEYALTHRMSFRDRQSEHSQSGRNDRPQTSRDTNAVCFYCKKPGHLVAECPVLRKKETKTVGLIRSVSHPSSSVVQSATDSKTGYEPFLSDGFVTLAGGKHLAPVRILRDTGAALSFLLEGILPLSDESKTGTRVLVRGFEMGSTVVPLHRIELNSNVVTGTVHVGVRKSFPLPGVTFILGNDIGGGNVFPQAVEPVVLEGAQQHPVVFPACKVEGEECTVRPTRPGKQVESHPGVREKRMPSEGPAVTVQSVAVSDIICSCVRSTSGYWYLLAMWAATLVVTLALLSSAAPGFSKPFCLAVDNGAGAVLFQLGADEIQLPVCYFSKKFNDQQRRYATTENATLVLLLAVHHGEAYLGTLQKVGVCSHHYRLALCASRSFTFRIFWQPVNFGTGNGLAYALSRIP